MVLYLLVRLPLAQERRERGDPQRMRTGGIISSSWRNFMMAHLLQAT
jgi:hypothetical protein